MSSSHPSAHGRRGFTLVETAIALGILSISIAALMNGAYLATDTKQDIRNVTRATLMAKAVMAEIEWKLQKDGFGAFEKTEGCDFRLDGLKEFSCDYTVKKVELPIGDMIQKLMNVGGGGLSNAVGGSASSSSTSSSPSPPSGAGGLAGIAGTFGGLSALAGGAGGAAGGGGLAGGLGGNALQLYATQMQTMLEEALREVRLTLSWKTGRKKWDSISVVTHLVEIGRAGVSAQDQLSGQISKQFGLQAPVPGQQGGLPGGIPGGIPGGMMPGGGFTGSPPPLPPSVQTYNPGSK